MSQKLSSRLLQLAGRVAPAALLVVGVSSASASYPSTAPINYGVIQPVEYRAYGEGEAEEAAPGELTSCSDCMSCDDNSCEACCTMPCYCWYVSLSGAWSNRETVHEEGDPTTFIEFNDGFNINVALGHEFDLFRVEFEYSYFNQQVALAGAGIPGFAPFVGESPGNISVKAFMLNVYHDFDFGGRLKPYVGGGIGLFQSEINSLLPTFFADAPFSNSTLGVNTTSDVAFAYQFRAGVNYELTRRTELFAGYRFFDNTDPLTFAAEPFGIFYPDSATFHNFEAGLRVKF
ncbi:MAG: outer membrane beta-barrel protein [Planctomycetia bacterium]|nr:outer membrane beta-barrel protein [Planctomycetia bacterium]